MPLIDLNGLGHFKAKENAMVADSYSATKTYAVGDYAYYNGTLYRCTTAITTAEAWTAGHWTAAKLGDDCSALKTAFTYNSSVAGLDFVAGFITTSGALSAGGTDRLATRFIPCPPNIEVTYAGESNHSSVNGISFYNKNFAYISGYANNGTLGSEITVVSPVETVYVRLSTKVAIKNQTKLIYMGNDSQALPWLQKQISNRSVYVNGTTGNDTTGDGSTGSPYKTIMRAINQGVSEICVEPGTYNETITASFRENLHIYANSKSWISSSPNVPKVIIDSDSANENGLTLSYIRNLKLENIVCKNATSDGALLTGCYNVEIQNCEFNSNGRNGIRFDYCNGKLLDCAANSNTNDGFNINYYGDVHFYNCSGHDNGDDGVSHHQGTTGSINGGEWYNNVKGGVASPTHGAKVDIYNIYSHDNGYGIYANADSDTTARTFHVWNSVLVNNSHYGITSKRNTAIMYNCKITGNTEGQTTAPSGGQIITL